MSRKQVTIVLCCVFIVFIFVNLLDSGHQSAEKVTKQQPQQQEKQPQQQELQPQQQQHEQQQQQRQCKSYLVYNYMDRGLANRIFYYASFLGINRRLKKCACALDITQPPFNYFAFNLTLPLCPDDLNITDLLVLSEKGSQIYSPDLLSPPTPDANITLRQYLESWRYFWPVFDEVRSNLLYNILPKYRNQCEHDWRTKVLVNGLLEHNNNNNNNNNNNCVHIGVHVRRGDFITLAYQGFVPASKEYLSRAISHFAQRFDCIQLVVIGNDFTWNTATFKQLQPSLPKNVNFLLLQPSHDPFIDICLLAHCDHTIMTTGTFGWWAAALAGGEVTYQRHYFTKGSMFAEHVNAKDHFPPGWVPL